MKPIKPALLATAAIISLLSLFPAASNAADAARVAGYLKVDGLHFSGDPNNTLITKPSDLAFPWTILGQNIYYHTGNVGIGKMDPDSALTVQGSSSAAVRIGDTGCISNNATFAGIGLFGVMSGCFNYAILGENGAKQNLYFNRPDGADMYFRMNNVDQMVLEKFGGLTLDAKDLNSGAFNHSATTGAGLAFGAGSGEGIASKRTAGGNQWGLDFYTAGTPRLSITYAGNVGIGTGATPPGSPLTVAGTIESTSGGVKFPDGTVQVTAKSDCSNGRYEDNGDGTISDCRTGLIWLKAANCTATSGGIIKNNPPTGYPVGVLNWVDANTWTAGLGSPLCGLSDGSSAGDWRLPTKTEWMAMVASARKQLYTDPTLTNRAGTGKWTAGDPFTDVQSSYYWSGTTYASSTNYAWYVDMYNGGVGFSSKAFNVYVWPVRSGQ